MDAKLGVLIICNQICFMGAQIGKYYDFLEVPFQSTHSEIN